MTALNGPEIAPPKDFSSGLHGSNGPHRLGRDGSRTPRSRVRDDAVSPPRVDRNNKAKFTPNGTRVPDGSPPELPPVPPMPPVETALGNQCDAAMYETYENKPRVKNGDLQWQPQQVSDRSLSAKEAKQVWIERETRSFREALDRLEIPPSFRDSPYWNAGFVPPQHAVLGENRGQVRAPSSSGIAHGDPALQARAFASTGSGNAVHGGEVDGGRALHGSRVLGPRDLLTDVPGQDRAFARDGTASGLQATPMGLHDRGRELSCDLPRHGGGGGLGGGSNANSWPESYGATANTKAELPDLPGDASPIQFGDWIHLCGPTMRDLSAVASRWWELTLRESKAYYATWKESTPLQRVQLQVKLPDELLDSRYMRTEQRGIQLLLKAVPAAEQQSLVIERALSSTAILYRLMVRFQPGGAGEKQILLQQLTNIPRVESITELANGLRSWRRHFGRATEVGAALPDGVLLLKALDVPLQQVAAMDAQASFRLAQSRVHLALDAGVLVGFQPVLVGGSGNPCSVADFIHYEHDSIDSVEN